MRMKQGKKSRRYRNMGNGVNKLVAHMKKQGYLPK